MPETKSFCTYEQQLQILKRRGLSIADDTLALQWLREKNYYRLSAYSLTLRRKNPSTGEDEFLQSSTFISLMNSFVLLSLTLQLLQKPTSKPILLTTMPANTVRSAIWMEIILKIPGGTLNF